MRFAVARQQGLDEDVAAQVVDGYEQNTSLGERSKAVLAFTDAFVSDPWSVADDRELQHRLRTHLAPTQLVELTLILGAFLGFAKLRIALGLVPQGGMETRVVPTPRPPTSEPAESRDDG